MITKPRTPSPHLAETMSESSKRISPHHASYHRASRDQSAQVGLSFERRIDAAVYAYRLRHENRVVAFDLQGGPIPETLRLLISDMPLCQAKRFPHDLSTRPARVVVGWQGASPPCECCQVLPSQAGWDDLVSLVRTYIPLEVREPGSTLAVLTPRETEVLRQVSLGLSVREVAQRLDLSESTVGNHKYRMMRKLGVRSSLQLMRIGVRHGLVDS